MNARVLLLLLCVVSEACAQSRPTFSSDPPSTPPLRSLTDARIFALGPVGYAGTTSQEEQQFRTMFGGNRDKTIQELEKLFSSKNPQAMSYALVGMRKVDHGRYAELLSSARASDVMVRTMSGCIIDNENLRTVANELDAGKYDPLLRWMPTLSF